MYIRKKLARQKKKEKNTESDKSHTSRSPTKKRKASSANPCGDDGAEDRGK